MSAVALGESVPRNQPSPAVRSISDEGKEDAEAVAHGCDAEDAEKGLRDGSGQGDGSRAEEAGRNVSGRMDTHTKDTSRATVDSILTDAGESWKELARRGVKETDVWIACTDASRATVDSILTDADNGWKALARREMKEIAKSATVRLHELQPATEVGQKVKGEQEAKVSVPAVGVPLQSVSEVAQAIRDGAQGARERRNGQCREVK